MQAMRTLMEKYWVIKDKEKEMYMKTKREISDSRKFLREQLGWQLINNERILKLEKIPAYAESFMGITVFTEIRDYCIFTALLIFLEDKEDHEQFLLSELVDMIVAQLQDKIDVDWTLFTHRKSLVRALQFAESRDLLEVYDGSSDSVTGGIEHEVLYENTGLSRYFATSFHYDIGAFTSYQDFEKEQMKELETNRGHFRINRVYRQLAATPAMYWENSDDQDAIYLKNQRQWVQKHLDEQLGGSLEIHKNAAFFVMMEDDYFGECHPREATIAEIILNVGDEIRKAVAAGKMTRGNDDTIRISETMFHQMIKVCKEKYQQGWSKEYREMEDMKLIRVLEEYMMGWLLLGKEEGQVIILPAAGKIIGTYPTEFLQRGEIVDGK
jgi:TIGR02678 family protein